MRILIIGASGMIGNAVFVQAKTEGLEVYGTFNSVNAENQNYLKLNISNNNELFSIFSKLRPDIVILAAACADVDFCQRNIRYSWLINTNSTRKISFICREIGAKLVFFSTDYVFDGISGPYIESAITNPINAYGTQKLISERSINGILGDQALIIRTCGVFGRGNQGKNFVSRLRSNLENRQKILVPCDQFATPIFVEDLAVGVLKLIKNQLNGIYHLSGADWISRYELALEVARTFALPEQYIQPVATVALEQVALRPLYAGLLNGRASNDASVRSAHISDALLRCRASEYK